MTVTTAVLCYAATPRTPQEHVAASTVSSTFVHLYQACDVYEMVLVLSCVSFGCNVCVPNGRWALCCIVTFLAGLRVQDASTSISFYDV